MSKEYPKTEGVKIWRNAKNRFTVFELHYSADPSKRDGQYRDKMKSSMPIKKFMQEMEIQWDTHAGHPVYPDFNEKLHVTDQEIETEVGLPLLIGIDFGLTPAAVVGQLQDSTLKIILELTAVNMGAERFVSKLSKELATKFPNRADFSKDYITFVDPSGFFRKDTDENTCANILRTKGFKPIPGPVAWEERRTSVEHFLTTLLKGKPVLQIYGPDCRMIVKGFNGGYMYAESAFDVEPTKIRPIKNEYSHCHDALQYLCAGIHKTKTKSKRTTVPSLAYTFSKDTT